MDRIFEQTLLYDFYGELLTPHQQKIYEEAVFNDMSLGEIAEEYGISRQGVHDLIRRCGRTLQDYESKLHLVERFARAKKTVAEIERLTLCAERPEETGAEAGEEAGGMELRKMQESLQAVRRLSHELLKEL